MPAPRKQDREHLPKGIYESRPGYFVYRSPVSGRTVALGAVTEKDAIAYGKWANAHAEGVALEEKFQRVKAPHALIDERGLLRKEHIIGKAMAFDKVVGVYFLLKGPEIVYVGQSTNVMYRLASHRYEATKDFDRVFVTECAAVNLDRLERMYIDKFKPIYNAMTFVIPEGEAVWSEDIRALLGSAIHSSK